MYYGYRDHAVQNHHLTRREVNVITVQGDGKVSVEPNIAFITVGVETENKNLQTAQTENSEKSARVIEALLGMGISREDIRTIEYRINNVYDFVEGRQIFRGYEVRHLLEVKVSERDRIGEVVDTVVAAGANIIYNVRFDITNRTQVYNQALTLAVKDAQQKASTLAASLGIAFQRIPFKITEARQGVTPVPFQTFEMTKVAGVSTPIEPGRLQIEASIIAKFAY